MTGLQTAWQANTVVPGDWGWGYKKYVNEQIFGLAQKELHGRGSPLALWSECQIMDLQEPCGKTWQQWFFKLLFGYIVHFPCCEVWILVCVKCIMLVFVLESRLITDLLHYNHWYRWFQMWVGCWRIACLCFGLFYFLHWAELRSLRKQPFQISAPGTVLLYFPVSLPVSRLLLPPLPPRSVSICLKGWLTHSFTAMQAHHLSSSQWQDPPPPPTHTHARTQTPYLTSPNDTPLPCKSTLYWMFLLSQR